MKIRNILTCTLICFCCTQLASADEPNTPESKPQTHNPDWTDINSSDPGVKSTADELQRIVVLCATDHQSAEFRRAWTAYVRKHKLSGSKLDETIRRVIDESFRHRRESGQGRPKNRARSTNWKSEASKTMHDTAKAAINNVRA